MIEETFLKDYLQNKTPYNFVLLPAGVTAEDCE